MRGFPEDLRRHRKVRLYAYGDDQLGCWNFVYQNGGYILDEDGVHSIGSSRGASSHQYNPFAVVCEKDCGEDRGWCWIYPAGTCASI